MGNAHRVTFLLTPQFRVTFARWQPKGKWQQIHDQLPSQLRVKQGRKPESTLGIADYKF